MLVEYGVELDELDEAHDPEPQESLAAAVAARSERRRDEEERIMIIV